MKTISVIKTAITGLFLSAGVVNDVMVSVAFFFHGAGAHGAVLVKDRW